MLSEEGYSRLSESCLYYILYTTYSTLLRGVPHRHQVVPGFGIGGKALLAQDGGSLLERTVVQKQFHVHGDVRV